MSGFAMKGARVIRSCAVLVTGLLFITGCTESAPSESHRTSAGTAKSSEAVRDTGTSFSAQELRQILQQREASSLSKSLNKAKKLGIFRDGAQLLEQVWSGDQSLYPELAWQAIADPQVRLDLVDLLVQASKNGEIEHEPAGMHDFVQSVLSTGSPKLVGQAAITLSLFDRDDDVPTLEQIALQRNSGTFRSIVIALSRMCAPAADAALARI